MTIVIASVAAPWGPIRVATSERGVVALEQLVSAEEMETSLARRFGTAAVRQSGFDAAHPAGAARTQVDRAVAAITAFLDGDSDAVERLPIDIADRSEWDQRVLSAVRQIPRGSTASYSDVARMVGKPGAARAVGGAVGRSPIGLAIPCHRVIAGDGSLGGYGGGAWGGREAGLALKRELLAREGVHIGVTRREP